MVSETIPVLKNGSESLQLDESKTMTLLFDSTGR